MKILPIPLTILKCEIRRYSGKFCLRECHYEPRRQSSTVSALSGAFSTVSVKDIHCEKSVETSRDREGLDNFIPGQSHSGECITLTNNTSRKIVWVCVE